MSKVLLLALMGVLCAAGADLTGNWKGQVNRPDGTPRTQVNLELKQDGEKITGRIGANDGDTAAIEKVKLEGDKFSFEVIGGSATYKISLEVAEDAMKGSVVREADGQTSPAMPLELKRAK